MNRQWDGTDRREYDEKVESLFRSGYAATYGNGRGPEKECEELPGFAVGTVPEVLVATGRTWILRLRV